MLKEFFVGAVPCHMGHPLLRRTLDRQYYYQPVYSGGVDLPENKLYRS